MGSSDGIKEALEKLTATLDKIQATQESMQASLDKLAPLAPLADQLAAIPAKVTSLQSSAYENAEQIRALNLAVIRAEKSLREENGAVGGDADASVHSIVKPLKHPRAPSDRLRQPREQFVDHQEAGGDHHDDSRFHPRVRLEFPCFDGKEDPLPWLNRCETFFRGQGTPEDRQMWYAAMHLTDAAQLWYARLKLTAGTPSWRRFVQLVHQRFGPPLTESPLGELVLLRRVGTVQEYTDQFLALACRDADLSDHQLVQIYTADLSNPLKTDVTLRRPATLDDAIISPAPMSSACSCTRRIRRPAAAPARMPSPLPP
jgi:hypothetical protein